MPYPILGVVRGVRTKAFDNPLRREVYVLLLGCVVCLLSKIAILRGGASPQGGASPPSASVLR